MLAMEITLTMVTVILVPNSEAFLLIIVYLGNVITIKVEDVPVFKDFPILLWDSTVLLSDQQQRTMLDRSIM